MQMKGVFFPSPQKPQGGILLREWLLENKKSKKFKHYSLDEKKIGERFVFFRLPSYPPPEEINMLGPSFEKVAFFEISIMVISLSLSLYFSPVFYLPLRSRSNFLRSRSFCLADFTCSTFGRFAHSSVRSISCSAFHFYTILGS